MAFAKSVFINCPFDDDYIPILRPIIFCVLKLAFEPRIASETLDSGEPRVTKIIGLIVDCKYAIHDLSRLQAKRKGEYYRLNMPFELGVDVGCRLFKEGEWSAKKCLILEAERYRYQAAISDLSNSDIAVHKNEPESALREVRNWLVQQARVKAPGPAAMWAKFQDFMAANYDHLVAQGYSQRDIDHLPTSEFMECVKRWLAEGE